MMQFPHENVWIAVDLSCWCSGWIDLMTTTIDLDAIWKNCGGVIPIFPLPDKVMLPQEIVPLHIFEPRYRNMIADVMTSERLLGMAMLKPGWEDYYQSKTAPIHEMICVGYVAADQKLRDGRSLIILQGLSRAVIEREIESDVPYRTAQCRIRLDRQSDLPAIDRQHRKQELLYRYLQLLPHLSLVQNGVVPPECTNLSLGRLSDLLASTLSLSADESLRILMELDGDERSELVLDLIKQKLRSAPKPESIVFPPQFSEN